MTDEDIIKEVSKYPAQWIVLTGGEPTMWIDGAFVRMLKETTGKLVAIETNGSLPVPSEIDWVTVSPKCGMTGAGDYTIMAEKADELKVVDIGQDLDQYFAYSCVMADTRMYLQPCFVADEKENVNNTRRTINRVLTDPRWTLSLQTHRLLNIP